MSGLHSASWGIHGTLSLKLTVESLVLGMLGWNSTETEIEVLGDVRYSTLSERRVTGSWPVGSFNFHSSPVREVLLKEQTRALNLC